MSTLLRTLLANAIDYAGMFPPAALALPAAAANYAAYSAGPDAWALGRLIVPAPRLDDLAAAVASTDPRRPPWLISALAGGDLAADLAAVERFNATCAEARVDALELKAATPAAIGAALAAVPPHLTAYVELPADEPEPLVRAVAAHGGRAKIRAGGVVADMIPPPGAVLRFIATCVDAGVPFKATAGLHHPLRGPYRLTYEPDSPTATMHGFLNLLLATAFLCAGDRPAATGVLEEGDPRALMLDARGVAWRGHHLGEEEAAAARRIIAGFGSCSFDEPMGELRLHGLLPPPAPGAPPSRRERA